MARFGTWIFFEIKKKFDRLTAKELIKEGQINTKKCKGLRQKNREGSPHRKTHTTRKPMLRFRRRAKLR
jgi:hypothetical protein